jgi:hypothetical protein
VAIKSPQTYGDFYWATQVEAQNLLDEQLEKLYAPYFADIFADIPSISELPSSIQSLIRALANPKQAGMGGFAIGFATASAKDALDIALSPMLTILNRKINASAREKWLTSAEANLLFSRKKIEENLWESILASEGYADVLGGFSYKAQLPYPSIPDLILYSRYHGDPDNVWSTLQDFYNIDPNDFAKWEWLSQLRFTAEQLHTLFRRNKITENNLYAGLAQMGWDREDRLSQIELGWQIPNAMLLIQGGLIEGIADNQLLKDVELGDIHPDFTKRYMDAVLTKPSTSDIIAYQLRKEPELSSLSPELRKIGIHPDYFDLYKELAQIIPPVGDIITMAVREAFTPDIAARFGQYEDFPEPFAEWAAKKGLSKEWASRYWAAHWTLPSPQQGFEMLHRGVIDQDTLNMLLRALDIMPFWRDKLTQIAYNVLTRVDIRRMYQIGVLNEGDVETAYKEAGYNERDAKRLTDFTVRITRQTLSKFDSGDIIAAYADQKIDSGEASRLLGNLGIKSSDIPNILEAANYKKKWALEDTQTKGIRNLYKRKIYTQQQAETELRNINIPSEQVTALINQWFYEVKAEEPKLWTSAQTLAFLKKGIINKARAKEELDLIGYTAERVNAYLESVEVVTK